MKTWMKIEKKIKNDMVRGNRFLITTYKVFGFPIHREVVRWD
ncbi:hypothetical protein [Ammoniphilus sp. 3BR4]